MIDDNMFRICTQIKYFKFEKKVGRLNNANSLSRQVEPGSNLCPHI